MKTSRFKFFLTTLLLFSLAPTFGQQEEASSKTVISSTSKNGIQRWRTTTGITDFNIEHRGTIELTDDDKDIKSLSNDGYLEISKTVFGSKRAIVIESQGGGRISREYYEGRSKKEWEPAGRQWLAEILPEVVRSTTLGAEGRVDRFFRQNGAKGVLNEISAMKSDYVKAHYGKLLLGKNITNAEMPDVITGLSNSIGSDYYLATLLKSNIGKLLVTREASDAFFKGVKNISSDYYKATVLQSALNKYAASPEQVKVILQTASTIKSDYYLATTLTSLINKANVKEESLNEMVTISAGISSDHYRTQVLGKVLQSPNLSEATFRNVVDAVASVNSDYYKSTVLTSLSNKSSLNEATVAQVVKITSNSMSSDHYSTTVLKSVLKNQKLSDEAFREVTAAASRIKSDYYASEVLKDAASKATTKQQMISILQSTGRMNSDHYMTTVLTSMAPNVKQADNDVKEAYRQAAKRIRSETYYGRALRAID
jgi:SOS response regulatory protein OraA/RecX